MRNALAIIVVILFLTGLNGCATVPPGQQDARDPWQSYNRGMYAFNDALDKAVMKPVARGYLKITPQFVQTGIGNFFSNFDDFVVLTNDILQLKGQQAASDLSRIVWNTTVGLGGFLDVASSMGMPKHNEDFGQTLGYWGVPSGPYLVLPFFGPSDLRDAPSMVVDLYTDPTIFTQQGDVRWGLFAINAVQTRAALLPAEKLLLTDSIDPYATLRDAYLQRRKYLVYDGHPPQSNSLQQELENLD
ncbi:MAG: VacJ family lipoprotein [Gammaproteobacteria bacterium]|jgi:phospholipid-binding lipoprotein MlaA